MLEQPFRRDPRHDPIVVGGEPEALGHFVGRRFAHAAQIAPDRGRHVGSHDLGPHPQGGDPLRVTRLHDRPAGWRWTGFLRRLRVNDHARKYIAGGTARQQPEDVHTPGAKFRQCGVVTIRNGSYHEAPIPYAVGKRHRSP